MTFFPNSSSHPRIYPLSASTKMVSPSKSSEIITAQQLLTFADPASSLQSVQSTIRSIKSVVPLLDRVLVQRFKPETKTTSGIFLPSSVASSPLPEASVISTGPGAPDKNGKIVPTSVKSGDKVLLPSWGGNSIKVGDDEYLLIRDSEILAKINE